MSHQVSITESGSRARVLERLRDKAATYEGVALQVVEAMIALVEQEVPTNADFVSMTLHSSLQFSKPEALAGPRDVGP